MKVKQRDIRLWTPLVVLLAMLAGGLILFWYCTHSVLTNVVPPVQAKSTSEASVTVAGLSAQVAQLAARQAFFLSEYFGVAAFSITIVGALLAFVALVSYRDVRDISNGNAEANKILDRAILHAAELEQEFTRLRLREPVLEVLASANNRTKAHDLKAVKELGRGSAEVKDALTQCVIRSHRLRHFELACMSLQWGDARAQKSAARTLGQEQTYATEALTVVRTALDDPDSSADLRGVLFEAMRNLEELQ
ncbi:MAG: hypothetical protein C4521_04865 [Actinobacteria bacterium]|nr:MAG: hypothetical protein C4521_04865 [Actinomycetota bacterium]